MLQVRSIQDPLDEIAVGGLRALLPEHIASRRWYRAKTKTIREIRIEDVIALPETARFILVLGIAFSDGEIDNYILPVASATGEATQEEVIAQLVCATGETGALYSALGDHEFRSGLLQAIVCEQQLAGRNGVLQATRTQALRASCEAEAPALESFVSRAEQSNTSIVYGNQFILKLFRKLETGINPDVEIGRFLTERGFRNTPAVLGSIEYRRQGIDTPYGVAILQQFVPNKGDAWKFTLDSLRSFFERALPGKRLAPSLTTEHPLMLIGQEVPPKLRLFVGDYLDAAALLGKRTAQMHAALADANGGPDFAPEPMSSVDTERLSEDLTREAKATFDLLRRRQSTLARTTAESVERLLALESQVASRLSALRNHQISAVRIRFHGDYHLGQVLYTGQDFMIIDFEGEPARPLAERRAKALALRDVAGMIRSFQYAAFAGLFGQIPGLPDDAASQTVIEGWATAWNAAVGSAYLKAYFEQAGSAPFIPSNWQERRMLLDAFILQKALYEVAYELNNRPQWLSIPLRGILSLLA